MADGKQNTAERRIKKGRRPLKDRRLDRVRDKNVRRISG